MTGLPGLTGLTGSANGHLGVLSNGGVLVSTKGWSHRLHVEEAWWASLKSLGKKINANDYEDLALAA